MTSKTFAQVMGIVFLAIGILGFVPALKSAPPLAAPHVAVDSGYGLLLGLFPVNWLHNLVHLAIGVWGWGASRSTGAARRFGRGLAFMYGGLAIMGLIPVLNTTFGLIPLFGHDVWLHAGTAAIAAYFGFSQRTEAVEIRERYQRAA
jgi:hypothetical protein